MTLDIKKIDFTESLFYNLLYDSDRVNLYLIVIHNWSSLKLPKETPNSIYCIKCINCHSLNFNNSNNYTQNLDWKYYHTIDSLTINDNKLIIKFFAIDDCIEVDAKEFEVEDLGAFKEIRLSEIDYIKDILDKPKIFKPLDE